MFAVVYTGLLWGMFCDGGVSSSRCSLFVGLLIDDPVLSRGLVSVCSSNAGCSGGMSLMLRSCKLVTARSISPLRDQFLRDVRCIRTLFAFLYFCSAFAYFAVVYQ